MYPLWTKSTYNFIHMFSVQYFWKKIKDQYEHYELIDKIGQCGYGIGVIRVWIITLFGVNIEENTLEYSETIAPIAWISLQIG